ncbi:MAG: gamma-glutamyl-gamma-aminobutyrate hydrolase family protein [Bacilli bacterium]|nr:gamma-glutamyl-gamma-aminobutyrate hydrolase family protein [Bacilli bacterium]
MMKIGIPLRYHHMDDGRCILYLAERVRRTIQKAGGFIIPIVQVQDVDYYQTRFKEFPELTDDEKKHIDSYLDMVDGVLFPGGFKITPFDVYLLERCIERNIPTLGICLGMQLMSCVGEDFKVYPNESDISHLQESDEGFSHRVKIDNNSLLYKILGEEEILVNSFHRYHVTIENSYIVNAISEDGYIEGIELPDQKFHLGIQWHPEISYEEDANSQKIIDYFLGVCQK